MLFQTLIISACCTECPVGLNRLGWVQLVSKCLSGRKTAGVQPKMLNSVAKQMSL